MDVYSPEKVVLYPAVERFEREEEGGCGGLREFALFIAQ